MIDVQESELLKETFKVKVSPMFVMLNGNMSYEYEGPRNHESLREFITYYHKTAARQYITPTKLGLLGL